MKYMGGKSRIAGQIKDVITGFVQANDELIPRDPLRFRHMWEPFCGGCNITEVMAPRLGVYHASDIDRNLIKMWQAVAEGWVPPDNISEGRYKILREQCKALDEVGKSWTAEQTFAAFACSWGAKCWGGYARGEGRNYAAEGCRSIVRAIPVLKSVHFTCRPYTAIRPCRGDIVYCDPPYEGTTGYKAGEFNHEEFWEQVRQWSIADRAWVFVSEYNAPDDFTPIWSVKRTKSLTKQDPQLDIDSLYVHSSLLE